MNIIFIGASWCSSCLVMRSRLGKALIGREEVLVKELDIDFDQDRAEAYNPGKILPVIIVFQGNQEFKRFVGEISIATLKQVLCL